MFSNVRGCLRMVVGRGRSQWKEMENMTKREDHRGRRSLEALGGMRTSKQGGGGLAEGGCVCVCAWSSSLGKRRDLSSGEGQEGGTCGNSCTYMLNLHTCNYSCTK